MFEDFLNHVCDIYHLEDFQLDVGYGIKKAVERRHEEAPSEVDVKCHFHIAQNDLLKIVQREPYSSLEGNNKLTLPAGTDIRENDKVVDKENGIAYRVGVPKKVHGGHHIVVMVMRMEGVESAI